MGRRPDGPALQDAKGNPGKRLTKAERRLLENEELARQLSAAPGSENDPLAPPQFLDKRFAPALAVWKDYAPRLHELNLLSALDRHTFAMFCVWLGEFVLANDDIHKKGYSFMVNTIAGGKMPRENPAVSRREIAAKFLLELSKRFGLSPLDRIQLMRDQAAGANHGLFATRGAQSLQQAGDAPEEDPVGVLDRFDSAPPTVQ